MALPIEDYALIGDCRTAALVGTDGSIDWMCLPRFDSPSTFAALLGTPDNGRWKLAPSGEVLETSRRYEDGTFILVTRWVTPTGEAEVTDVMPQSDRRADVLRRVTGIRGSVEFEEELAIRFDYGGTIPWVRQVKDVHSGRALIAVAGPNAVIVRGPHLHPRGAVHTATFTVSEQETVDLTLTWYPSHREAPPLVDVTERLRQTRKLWTDWASTRDPHDVHPNMVSRSLLVLRALTDEDTGGIVAAATTSLPEDFGGVRNWDYRYVWLRDAALTLHVLLDHGYTTEAKRWRRWLLRAIAGDPADVQIMYGIAGERMLAEYELEHLSGYEGSTPVRVGNGAYTQYQGDVFGEVMIALQSARDAGVEESKFSWPLQRALMSFVETNWQRPDNGIWEIRGPQRHFTHSRAMIWAPLVPCASTDCPAPRRSGSGCVTRSRRRSRRRASTLPVTPTPSTTVAAGSTRHCSSCRRSAISPLTTRACSEPSRRSNASCCTTASCCATPPIPESMGWPETSIRSSPARSGWSSNTRRAGGWMTRSHSWTGSAVSRTTSG